MQTAYIDWPMVAKVHDHLMSAGDAPELFCEPVDMEIVPDYAVIIACPMDFGTIRSKLRSRTYKCLDNYIADVQLVFDNAYLYNNLRIPDIAQSANDLEWVFNCALERIGVIYEATHNRIISKPEPSNINEDGFDDFCHECSVGGNIICCSGDGCSRCAHAFCANLEQFPPEDEDWFCNHCNGNSHGVLLAACLSIVLPIRDIYHLMALPQVSSPTQSWPRIWQRNARALVR